MVIYDHEVFATAGRSEWKTSGLVSAHFSCKLHRLHVHHLGLDLRFLRRKGWGCHNRRLGDGSGGRSVSDGSYVLLFLAEVTFCGGKDFGQMFADKSRGGTWPCGEETSGDCGGTG